MESPEKNVLVAEHRTELVPTNGVGAVRPEETAGRPPVLNVLELGLSE